MPKSEETLAKRKTLADRREKAWDMLSRGATDEMIVAAGIGYSDAGKMRADLRKWRSRRVQRAADGWFDKQMGVLERLLAQIGVPIGVARTTPEIDPKTGLKTGRQVALPRTPEDDALDVQRGRLVVSILERMARMTGTDAPKKLQHGGAVLNLTPEDVRGMTTEDLRYVRENGRLPPKSPLRLVSNGGSISGSGRSGEGG